MSAQIHEHELAAHGCPFMHQDAMVMVCAQASLWMAARFLSLHNGAPPCYPPDITLAAYKNFAWYGDPLPAEGLTVEHMVNALSHMGYSPLFWVYGEPDSDDPADAIRRTERILRDIMPYLESNLPVILCPPEHAVCAIGYVLGSAPGHAPTDGSTPSLANWTEALVIHDDADGPYRIMPRDLFNHHLQDPPHSLPSSFMSVDDLKEVGAALVPLPHRVYITANAVETAVRNLLTPEGRLQAGDLLSKAVADVRSSVGDVPGLDEWERCRAGTTADCFVLRTFLVDAMQFLVALGTPEYKGVSEFLRARYREMHWPKRIWITEITTSSRMNGNRTVLGEIISDPTANRYGDFYLAIHLPGAVIDVEARQIVVLPDDGPYAFGDSSSFPGLKSIT